MDFSKTSIVELATIVADHLQQHGIDVVLVGGLAVEIYTENLYLTKDIDMVNTNYKNPQELRNAMSKLGFQKKGRVFVNPTTDITIEFPSGPLSVGDESVVKTTMAKVAMGKIPILEVSDVIKDRLAAYIHWRDRQSLVQALAILLKYPTNRTKLKPFCDREGGDGLYLMLENLLKKAKSQKLSTMEQLQQLVTDHFIENL
jgi:hypothetical protein